MRSFIRGLWAEMLLCRREWGSIWERDVKFGLGRLYYGTFSVA